MNDNNVTQEFVEKIAEEQGALYLKTLESILTYKNTFLNKKKPFEEEIFTLQKLIHHNKRLGYYNAVLRDEVLIKSYQVVRVQNNMIRNILQALDHNDYHDFEKAMNNIFIKSQLKIQKITDVDYTAYLKIDSGSNTLKQAQSNIRDFYAIQEINSDILNYLSIFEKRMYRLNEYSRFGLIGPVLYLEKTVFTKIVNPVLQPFNLNSIKLLLLIFLFILVVFIRKILFQGIQKFLDMGTEKKKYSPRIFEKIKKPLRIIIFLIGAEIAAYIYNDFSTNESLGRFFNMAYTLSVTFIVYKMMNTIAFIKLETFDYGNHTIKSEMINVGIKIINFIIIIIGILFTLSFAGFDLTTVLSGLGIGGFAVALAARESLSNFFGTISILLSDVFSQGDWIVVNGEEGVVVEIGLRVTTVRTFDNALIAIPNATLANGDVKNWDKRKIGRRIKMNLGVKYDSKASDIKNAVKEIHDMLSNHPDLATENTSYKQETSQSVKLVSQDDDHGVKRTLLVYLDEFSDSSINILVYCFSISTEWNEWLEVKQDVMFKMMDILEKNSLSFAFPSLSIYKENGETKEEL